FGELYAELVQETTKGAGQISFRGISMGAPFALETAKKLLANKLVTQDRNDKTLPHLAIRIDTPPSQNDTQTLPRRWQVPFGFALDGLGGFLRDPMTRASGNPLTGNVVENL